MAMIGFTRSSTMPREHLEFPLWYLKAKGLIAKTENGTFAITVEGVDSVNAEHRQPVNSLADRHNS
jgi:hypothetical protein